MIRLCLKQFGNESKLAVLALTEPSKSLKCTSTFNSITRKYAIKLKEETPIGTEKIYYGTLTPQIKAIKIFSLCTSIAGIAIQPMLIREASSIGSTSLLVAICSVVGFFTFVTPILLHFITKKYVTEIYYNAETSTYKAITINFFATKRIVSKTASQRYFLLCIKNIILQLIPICIEYCKFLAKLYRMSLGINIFLINTGVDIVCDLFMCLNLLLSCNQVINWWIWSVCVLSTFNLINICHFLQAYQISVCELVIKYVSETHKMSKICFECGIECTMFNLAIYLFY